MEAAVHGFFRVEGLDDAQAAQGFIYLAHGVAPQGLCFQGGAFELLADKPHYPHEGRCKDNGEQHHFRADPGERGEIENDEDGVLDEHGQGGDDGILHLRYIAGDAGNDVSFAFLREKADGQAQDFVVYATADFLGDAR